MKNNIFGFNFRAVQQFHFMEASRYLAAGGIACVLDLVAYSLMISIGAHFLAAAAIGFFAGLLLTYSLSVHWVFDSHRVSCKGTDFLLFFLTGVFGLLLTAGILWVLIDNININPLMAKIMAAAVVVVFNFFIRKKFIFSTLMGNSFE